MSEMKEHFNFRALVMIMMMMYLSKKNSTRVKLRRVMIEQSAAIFLTTFEIVSIFMPMKTNIQISLNKLI